MSEEPRVFHCRCCGNCCRWEGIVRYLPQEGAQIARFLGISEDELIQKYTRLAPDRKGLVFQEQPDGACIFLTPENRCAIHPVKPQKCRDYPYRWQTTPEQQHLCQGFWSENAQ